MFVCFFEKRCTNSLHYLSPTNRRQKVRARARNLFPFLSFSLSLSVEDRRRLCASPRRLSLACILERRPRLLRKIFEFTNRCVLSNSLQFRVRTDAQQRKNKNLHSPLIEHGQRRDQSNELDHPVVAPRSVHGVSDAGAPMMQSSSSLSSCVRNVFFQSRLLRKVKKSFSKGPKKTKKRSRRFDFFAEKVLLWKRRRPVV